MIFQWKNVAAKKSAWAVTCWNYWEKCQAKLNDEFIERMRPSTCKLAPMHFGPV